MPGVVPPQMKVWSFAFELLISLFLHPFEVSLNSSIVVWCMNHSSQFCDHLLTCWGCTLAHRPGHWDVTRYRPSEVHIPGSATLPPASHGGQFVPDHSEEYAYTTPRTTSILTGSKYESTCSPYKYLRNCWQTDIVLNPRAGI